MIAVFEHAYPGVYHNPARWRTRDGVIPWQAFFLLLAASAHLAAADELRQVRAGTLAAARVNKPDALSVRSAMRALQALASPVVRRAPNEMEDANGR